MEDEACRMPTPSQVEHIAILMKTLGRRDLAKKKYWFIRTFGVAFMMMMYTVGYMVGYDADKGEGGTGKLILSNGENWELPDSIVVGSAEENLAASLQPLLRRNISEVTVSGLRNITEFKSHLSSTSLSGDNAGLFLISDRNYTIYYYSDNDATFSYDWIAGTQHVVNTALLDLSGRSISPVSRVQNVPEIQYTSKPLWAIPFGPGALVAMACALLTMFVFLPIVQENLKEVVRAYRLVGVHMRSYLLSWVLYLSLNGLLTAGVMTFVTYQFRLYSRSNQGLVYLSHYLALVHLYCVCSLSSQFVQQEELANGLPWMVTLISIGVGALAFGTGMPDGAIAVLTACSPYFGIIHYSSVYGTYDYLGYGTGVHPSDIESSGLLAAYIGQFCGIMLWLIAMNVYSSDRLKLGSVRKGKFGVQDLPESSRTNLLEMEHIEPLSQNANVLVSVKKLFKSFQITKNCRVEKSVDILKGLDMTICRDEVFGFLGHNGAGKTTCIRLMSGELTADSGDISFNFESGPTVDVKTIRKKIGVCPQHNMLLHDDDTCREILTLYANLKGNIVQRCGQSHDEAVAEEVQRRIDDMKFTSPGDEDKPLKTFSGGMKRKVSIAIACLGSPEAIFLDEPTAGMDPYNRRQVWDMILEAKKGRSVILTTHFMEEADILSDRVCIINKGKVVTCGSTLFLKHHFGVGYKLNYKAPKFINVKEAISEATSLEVEGIYHQGWSLPHGSEKDFPTILNQLSEIGATDVTLGLTTLEEVFLETGKEEYEPEPGTETEINVEHKTFAPDISAETLATIWDPVLDVRKLTFLEKNNIVQNFMMRNAAKQTGSIAANIVMPLVYLVGGFVAAHFIKNKDSSITTPDDIIVSTELINYPMRLFGFVDLPTHPIDPLLPVPAFQSINEYFNGTTAVVGGYYSQNETLQHFTNFQKFALIVTEMVYSNYAFWSDGSEGIDIHISQLPYQEKGFRVDMIILPIVISFGVVGLVLSALDVLLLKSNNIFNLFRVAGVSDWQTYLGVATYKCLTTYLPFMIVIIILGNAFQSVLFGNGGRWLATVMLLLAYAFSVTPTGLLFSFILKSDFEKAKNWFPPVYMTAMSVPYAGWSVALQVVNDDAKSTVRAVGDFICVFPPFAFQRGLGGVIDSSPSYDDNLLSWSDVWSWKYRVWFTILMMFFVGVLEWMLLRRLSFYRMPATKLTDDEKAEGAGQPVHTFSKPDVALERTRSMSSDSGINARDLVKCFRVHSKEDKKKKALKRAVKGISFGIHKNEIFVLLGPNGAGKTATTSILTGEHTPEYGEIALNGKVATTSDDTITHLFADSTISSCPQFDSLFLNLTVTDHMNFYSKLRGLDSSTEEVKAHITAILSILGLTKYEKTPAKDLSGGYKRRLSLAISMVGFPKGMLIDEVTTGMDPAARHLVWAALKPGLQKGSGSYDLPAILLSTHYMDEASKLGSRIGIMIDGEMVTTGTLGSLNEKFCNSYFLEVALQEVADPNILRERALNVFRESGMNPEVYEHISHRYKIQIPFSDKNPTSQLADIFSVIETHKASLCIEYYSVAQMSLEQIFIDLSRKQFNDESEIQNV